MIQWLGAILIAAAGGICGFSMAKNYCVLEQNLRQLCNAMEIMLCQMEYRLTPLPELCGILSSACGGGVGPVFRDLGQALQEEGSCNVEACMVEALGKNPELSQPCTKIMRSLGKTLGQMDLQTQLKGIELEQKNTKIILEQVTKERPGRVKSYRTLGVCCGTALAILLL